MTPGSIQQTLQYYHPFIALDGTFWKDQWDLTLFLVVTIDSNDEILLEIRFGIGLHFAVQRVVWRPTSDS
jgi:hypothetical protein